jgi:arginine/ornithine N-succinyltransferase beta subunit
VNSLAIFTRVSVVVQQEARREPSVRAIITTRGEREFRAIFMPLKCDLKAIVTPHPQKYDALTSASGTVSTGSP